MVIGLKAQLQETIAKSQQLKQFANSVSPVDIIDLNVRGEPISTSLTTIRKITGSKLAALFDG